MHKKWETRLVRRWQAFAQNPYQHLLLSLLFIFFTFIFLDSDDAFSTIAINALFLLAVLFVSKNWAERSNSYPRRKRTGHYRICPSGRTTAL